MMEYPYPEMLLGVVCTIPVIAVLTLCLVQAVRRRVRIERVLNVLVDRNCEKVEREFDGG